MVPLRGVFEWLGARIERLGDTTLRVTRGEAVVSLEQGSKRAEINGRTMTLPQAVTLRGDGVTYVPLRSLCDALGATINWSAAEQLYVVSLGGKQAKLVTAKMPVGQTDIVWVSSVPLGCHAAIEGTGVQGPTPLAAVLPPGAYVVSVEVPYQTLGMRDASQRGEASALHKAEARIGEQLRGRIWSQLHRLERDDGWWGELPEMASSGGESEADITISGYSYIGVPDRWGIVRFREGSRVAPLTLTQGFPARMYKVEKRPNAEAVVVALFQPNDQVLSEIERLTPEGRNFGFGDDLAAAVLTQAGVSTGQVPALLRILHRGGKVVCRGARGRLLLTVTAGATCEVKSLP